MENEQNVAASEENASLLDDKQLQQRGKDSRRIFIRTSLAGIAGITLLGVLNSPAYIFSDSECGPEFGYDPDSTCGEAAAWSFSNVYDLTDANCGNYLPDTGVLDQDSCCGPISNLGNEIDGSCGVPLNAGTHVRVDQDGSCGLIINLGMEPDPDQSCRRYILDPIGGWITDEDGK